MKRTVSIFAGVVLILFVSLMFVSQAKDKSTASKNSEKSLLKSPPPKPFVDVSQALKGALPDFIPGLGTLYVDPSKLPEGPFLAYDKKGELIKIVFMVPLEKLQSQTIYTDLAQDILSRLGNKKVDHVNFIYSGPHPGVTMQHYHIELVLVSAAKEKQALGDKLY